MSISLKTIGANESAFRTYVGAGSVVALLVVWEGASRLGLIDVRTMSSPLLISDTARDLLSQPSFWDNAWVSLLEFLWGMLASCVVGIPLGIATGRVRTLRLIVDPIIAVFYSVPTSIFLPLIILWFGVGLNAYAFLVFFSAVFSIIVNSAAGLQQVDPSIVRAARSFGASRFDIFRLVLLPSSLVFIMTGIRLGLGRGLTAVVIAEMYFSVAGIGNLIMKYQAGLNTNSLMVIACVVGAFGVATIALAMRVEKALAPWRSTRIN